MPKLFRKKMVMNRRYIRRHTARRILAVAHDDTRCPLQAFRSCVGMRKQAVYRMLVLRRSATFCKEILWPVRNGCQRFFTGIYF
jgi:hypothetical protein